MISQVMEMVYAALKRAGNRGRAAERGTAATIAGRRGSRRFRVGWDALVRGVDCDGNTFEEAAKTKYISSTGGCLLMPPIVRAGAQVYLSVRVPLGNRNWMSYAAEVVWVKKSGSAGTVAIKFISSRPIFLEGRR